MKRQCRYNPDLKKRLQKEKGEVEKKLHKIRNNQAFIQEMTEEKRKLAKEIKRMDETLNNPNRLQEEYERRNEFLPLEEKIFSRRILSQMMVKERKEKLKKLEKLNHLLNPQNFVALKKELETKERYLQLLDCNDLEEKIIENILKLQKLFLLCIEMKAKRATTKQEVMKLIYEFRYYCLLPFDNESAIYQLDELALERTQVEKLLVRKAHEFKLIDNFSKEEEMDYQILRNIFYVRVINLEDLYIKVMHDKNKYFVQLFDENVFEEKTEIETVVQLKNRDLPFKMNKKVKIFN